MSRIENDIMDQPIEVINVPLLEFSTKLTINNEEYWIHPNYNLYAASKDWKITNIVKQKPIKCNMNNGYFASTVRKHGQKKNETNNR